jgi:hypothetical protein
MASPDPSDRHAYLEEQIARQKRGEPVDIEWVKNELERVRREQTARLATSQRNLRWVTISAAALLLVLWLKNGGLSGNNAILTLGLSVIGILAAVALGRKRR